jgi:hypothetical protein
MPSIMNKDKQIKIRA